MRAWVAAAAVVLAAAVGLGWRLRKPPLYAGVSFSACVYDKQGGFLRVLPSSDGRLRVFAPLRDFSPLLVSAARLQKTPKALARGLACLRLGEAGPEGDDALLRARRVLETARLRAFYSSDQLLEAYLNLAPFGPGIDGAQAASLVYFGKNADQLTFTEALELSVIPDHPIRQTLTGRDNGADRKSRAAASRRLRGRLGQREKSTGAVAVTSAAPKVTDRTNALHIFMGKE